MAFADNLKKLRENKKMTQVDLAKALGVTQRTISYYETGKGIPNDPEVLDKLAKTFNTSLDFLLLDESNQDSKLHRLVNKLLKDTTKQKIEWITFDKAVYYYMDSYNNHCEALCRNIFILGNFPQYRDYAIRFEHSYFCNYKDGGYLLTEIYSPTEVIYTLFALYQENFHYIADMDSIVQIEDLYIEISSNQKDVTRFIDSYLNDPLEKDEDKITPVASEVFPDEEVPF